jgi:hypothetical protein
MIMELIMDLAIVFTREECLALNQKFIYYGDIDNVPYFAMINGDTSELVPFEQVKGGIAVYFDDDGILTKIPPPPKLTRS